MEARAGKRMKLILAEAYFQFSVGVSAPAEKEKILLDISLRMYYT
jgi:hypothetical protein